MDWLNPATVFLSKDASGILDGAMGAFEYIPVEHS